MEWSALLLSQWSSSLWLPTMRNSFTFTWGCLGGLNCWVLLCEQWNYVKLWVLKFCVLTSMGKVVKECSRPPSMAKNVKCSPTAAQWIWQTNTTDLFRFNVLVFSTYWREKIFSCVKSLTKLLVISKGSSLPKLELFSKSRRLDFLYQRNNMLNVCDAIHAINSQ